MYKCALVYTFFFFVPTTEYQQVSSAYNKQTIQSTNISEMKMRIKRDSPCLVLRFMPINKLGKYLFLLFI